MQFACPARGLICAHLATTMAASSGGILMRALLLMVYVAAACPLPALAASVGSPPPAKPVSEFAPRKTYRECLNRNFALRLIRERNVATPDVMAEEAVRACRAEEGVLAEFAGVCPSSRTA
jgi:hypothetical protein